MKSILSIAVVGAMWLSLSTSSARAMDGQDLSKVPPKQVEMYLDGFHNFKSDLKREPGKQLQLRVAHFCVHNSSDLIQCMLFDTNGSVEGKHPRLLGVEYVITDKVYQSLSKSEKEYWHPHDGEVSSGMLILPGMPKDDQEKTLKFVSTTWGKTWHAWNPERQSEKGGSNKSESESKLIWPDIPTGPAQLMWSVRPADATAETKKVMADRAANAAF